MQVQRSCLPWNRESSEELQDFLAIRCFQDVSEVNSQELQPFQKESVGKTAAIDYDMGIVFFTEQGNWKG